VLVLARAELARIYRLGSLPYRGAIGEGASAGGGVDGGALRLGPRQTLTLMRAGYRVSSTRENTVFNMLGAFTVAFALARGISAQLRTHSRVGPFRNLKTGGRHIHHFVPGGLISLFAGGVALARRPDSVDRWLAIPFGVGIGLVLDEAALLLDLEDVYWTEEGVLSIQVGFATIGLLAALAYALGVRRRGAPGAETDWLQAARAWNELQALGGTRRAAPPGAPGA
jgi:hypothetical protein